jgi:2Fe-2S ferredoxin|tara:strand:- start:8616 stop:8927 length:312 start_codon:yes stop_codon:yes gene_type:complete
LSKIIVKDRSGISKELSADSGLTLMEIIRDAGMDIEAACGGCCACATCHLYISEDWVNKLKPKDDDEISMLDQAFNVEENSRLGCQIEFSDDLDGILVELAPE